jgi:hypothetical protein
VKKIEFVKPWRLLKQGQVLSGGAEILILTGDDSRVGLQMATKPER